MTPGGFEAPFNMSTLAQDRRDPVGLPASRSLPCETDWGLKS